MMHQNPFIIVPTLSLASRPFSCAEARLRSSWHWHPFPQAPLRPFLRLRYVQSSNDDDDDGDDDDGAYTPIFI